MLLELLGFDTDKLIVFRSMLACIIAFSLSMFLIPYWILRQKMKSISENIEKKQHSQLDTKLSMKKDTPTIGGIFIYIVTLGGLAVVSRIAKEPLITILVIFGVFLIVGLVDDIFKYVRKGRGLPIIYKFLLLIGAASFSAFLLFYYIANSAGSYATVLKIPGITTIDLGAWYFLFLLFAFMLFTNGVNFSDGLDGLAAGTFAISLLGLTIISYISGRIDFSRHLGIPYLQGSAEMTIFLASLCGAVLGFLWFNFFPSQIFMGDCGAIALGSVLVAILASTKTEFLLIGFGGIYIAEFMSSFIQVGSFKLFKKRLLLIAPFHYIPYLKGVHENKVILRTIMIHFFICMASFFLLKL